MQKRLLLAFMILLMGVPAWAQQPITPDNVDDVVRLARYGQGIVQDIVYAPNGSTAALAGDAGIWLYNPNDLSEPPHPLDGNMAVDSIVYSSDSSLIVGVSGRKTAVIWDAASRSIITEIEPNLESVSTVILNPDVSLLMVGGCDVAGEFSCDVGGIEFWHINRRERAISAEAVQFIGGLETAVSDLALNPDSTLLAVGGYTATSLVYDISDITNPTTHFTLDTGLNFGGYSVAISADGRTLTMTGANGILQQWSLETGARLNVKTISNAEAGEHNYSFDGSMIAVARKNGDVILLDGTSLETLATLQGHTGWTTDVAFSPDGTRLLTSVPGEDVLLWDVDDPTQLARLEAPVQSIQSIALSPDGSMIAAAGNANEIWLYAAATGEILSVLRGHTAAVYDVEFSPDGRLIASVAWTGAVRLWDARTGAALAALTGHHDGVNALDFSPDGSLLATGGEFTDGTIRFWDVTLTDEAVGVVTISGEQVNEIPVPALTNGLDFSPDGLFIAGGAQNRHLYIWDVQSGEVILDLQDHTGSIRDVGYNAEGTQLVSSSDDKRAIVWDTATGEALMNSRTGSPVNSGIFSPDGRLNVIGDTNGSIGWVNVPDVEYLRTVSIDESLVFAPISKLVFHVDGTFVVAGSSDGTVSIWGLPGALDVIPAPAFTGNALTVGVRAWVNTSGGDILNLRSAASTEGEILHRLNDATPVEIIGGPTPNGDFVWWQVRLDDGIEGWVVERVSGIDTLVFAG